MRQFANVMKAFLPALIVPSAALITTLPVNKFPNKLAHYVLNNIHRNSFFCSFGSFLIVSLMPFINKPDSLGYLIIFMILFIHFRRTRIRFKHVLMNSWICY